MPAKEQIKSPKTRNSKEKNKQFLEHLVYNILCVEENDPLDKMLKCKTCTICKPVDLLYMPDEEIKALTYPGGDDKKKLTPMILMSMQKSDSYRNMSIIQNKIAQQVELII